MLNRRKCLHWVHSAIGALALAAGYSEELSVPPLESVEAVRTLAQEDVARGAPVGLTGIVSAITPKGVYINAGGRCIFLDWEESRARGVWTGEFPANDVNRLGVKIKVWGLTAPGNYSPKILPKTLELSRDGSLPKTRTVPLDRLLSGNADGQWISLQGVVQEAARTGDDRAAALSLLTSGHLCRVTLWDASGIDLEKIIDARVEVRGVFSPLVNLRKEMSGLALFSTNEEDIRVVEPAPADPFALEPVRLVDLAGFAPKDFYPWHRRLTTGTVNFALPGRFFFVQDGEMGVRVNSTDMAVRSGDRVRVAGFVSTTHTLAGLNGAIVRRESAGDVPSAMVVSSSQLLRPNLRNPSTGEAFEDWHGRRITLSGILRRIDDDNDLGVRILMMESEGLSYAVKTPFGSDAATPQWDIGSLISTTGTCDLNFAERPVATRAIPVTGFTIWTGSPHDLVLLSKPPWWTPGRMWMVIGGVALLLASALLWVRLLRREVDARGNHLAVEITRRNEARLRFETTLRERNLLASDLHDSLEQSLVGLSLQLQAASLYFDNNPELSRRHLALADTFLDRGRDEMRRTVKHLRDTGISNRSLLDSLRECASVISCGGFCIIDVTASGLEYPLSEHLATNLIMLAQEAITNAIKHGSPTRIDVVVDYLDAELVLRISDDGSGFDERSVMGPGEGHYGLQGMRERTKRIGAALKIRSFSGGGTVVEICLPRQASMPEIPGSDVVFNPME
jgi:signal transduction histidine kinase